ncbi:MAG: hypothetical protein JO336_06385 [Acidobacteriia bacterium]|nr:hypothetical protein [Terriglobia bacterium]MBV8905697.1 hypothetical protein [Terriglobia bacterium]
MSFAELLRGNQNQARLHDRIVAITGQLLAEDAKPYDALRLRGHLANKDRDFAAAEKYFQKANEIRPLQPEIVTGWMQAMYYQRKRAEEEDLGWQLIRANRAYGPVYDQLFSYYRASGHLPASEKVSVTRVRNNSAAVEPVNPRITASSS